MYSASKCTAVWGTKDASKCTAVRMLVNVQQYGGLRVLVNVQQYPLLCVVCKCGFIYGLPHIATTSYTLTSPRSFLPQCKFFPPHSTYLSLLSQKATKLFKAYANLPIG